jgi:hypothetical protein
MRVDLYFHFIRGEDCLDCLGLGQLSKLIAAAL